MLSEEALRRIGDVDRAPTEQRIRRLFELWSRGDVAAIIEHLAPDVIFPSHGFWSGSSAPVHGRERAAAALRKWADAFENIVSVLHEVLIDGDRAVVHRTAVGRLRDSGRRYQCDSIAFFRFRDGLIVEYSDYPDAAVPKLVANG